MNVIDAPKVKLTSFSHGGSCGCKIAPGLPSEILKNSARLPVPKELLVGITDPQTSGGLLVCCAREVVDDVLSVFRHDGLAHAADERGPRVRCGGVSLTVARAAALLFKAALVAALASLVGVAQGEQPVLKVSAIPDEAPTELQRKFAPLGKYLEKETGMKVEFVPVTDYAAVVEALASRRLDMAWLGGFTFVQTRLRTNGTAIPIVQRQEDAAFTSRFITAQPTIKSLADLKGKTFVFGSPSSTSGHLMPRYFLMQHGIDPDKDFKHVAFSGAHDATATFVASGKVDAGVLNASVWDKLVEEKKVDPSKVRVFATTPPYFDYNWTVRGDLDPALVKRLTHAFLALDPNNPEHKEILALQRATKFIPTKAENYAGIESAARSAGLLN